MIKMTTPDIVFHVDVDLTDAPEVSITFKQDGCTVLQLDRDALVITPTTITHTFTQEESANFRADRPLRMQIKALKANGRVISHDPVQTTVADIFDRRVFGNE